ncbi:hypothetical protein WA026_005458 [Henosepilachna vigintioctopunctata]|uniref:Uncharacterized protein n=1 Tax=Henosepilachna vigintioctopunctata TaxID=420089 RepID=A0AAW1TWD3_9CUCU
MKYSRREDSLRTVILCIVVKHFVSQKFLSDVTAVVAKINRIISFTRNFFGFLCMSKATEVSAEDVGEWMACDTFDPGFQILNDDEIVVSVREDVEVEVEEELSADVEVDAGPSASEAFADLETALKWMERQPECDHLQLLTVKRMRDLADRKRLKTAKQLTLTEMFKKQ